jgi:hypothetical protein
MLRKKDPGQKGGPGVSQGFSSAEQIRQRPLDQYLLDGFLIAHFSKGICIQQPPETQIVEEDDFFFFIHGQRSFVWRQRVGACGR